MVYGERLMCTVFWERWNVNDVWWKVNVHGVEDTKGQSESVNRRRADNTIAKSTKGQTTIYTNWMFGVFVSLR
jgi:hypothetical protein